MKTLDFYRGYAAGVWQQIKRRANFQYVRGYLAGMFGRTR